jgi:hypothetical protein
MQVLHGSSTVTGEDSDELRRHSRQFCSHTWNVELDEDVDEWERTYYSRLVTTGSPHWIVTHQYRTRSFQQEPSSRGP